MPKNVCTIMTEKDFADGVKLKKPSISKLFKAEKHPLKVIEGKLKAYHLIARPKIDERHAALAEIVELCQDYAGGKPDKKQNSKKVVTVRALELQATTLVLLEVARAKEVAEQERAKLTTAKGKGQATLDGGHVSNNKFEVLNKAGGPAVTGEVLVQFAKEKFGVELTGDDEKDYYAMKKVLKAMTTSKDSDVVQKLNLTYMNAEERDEYLLLFVEDGAKGAVVKANGDRLTTKIAGKTASSFLYAIDPDGYFYTASMHDKVAEQKIMHHSSFLAGAPALCAGELRTVEGRLIDISNESGHYLPKFENLMMAAEVILGTGYDPDGDGHVLFNDYVGKYQPLPTGKKSVQYRVPLRLFVEKGERLESPDDFKLEEKKFTSRPDAYVDPAAAKRRGCSGLNVT